MYVSMKKQAFSVAAAVLIKAKKLNIFYIKVKLYITIILNCNYV